MLVRVSLDFSAFGRTKWYEYAVRFLFGGTITVIAGLLAKQFGPAFGGLFLAFPAIFPASATLVEKHEKEKKQRAGILHTSRGRQAAAVDAAGAAMGSLGLALFGFTIWKLLPVWSPWAVLLCGTVGWLVTSFALWRIRKDH
jgi:Protein of unknown function (DUF3147)